MNSLSQRGDMVVLSTLLASLNQLSGSEISDEIDPSSTG